MTGDELDAYAVVFGPGGFSGPISWYRDSLIDFEHARAYGGGMIGRPAGVLHGDRKSVPAIYPRGLEVQRQYCADVRMEHNLPDAGHWIRQERPEDVTAFRLDALVGRPGRNR